MNTSNDRIAEMGIRRPLGIPGSVNDIIEHSVTKSWTSKSGGVLTVPIRLTHGELVNRFLTYNNTEVGALQPFDIKGLRVYEVSGIPKGKVGGTEFHRVRQELVFCSQGHVTWACEDVFGNVRTFELIEGRGVEMPPFILHRYTCHVDGTRLTVFCNTLFDADNPLTHDTYTTEVFRSLQTNIKSWMHS